MMACTSPAFTVRSRPRKISLPSIPACKFLISNKAINNSNLLLRRLATAPTPAPFALGLAAADDEQEHEGKRIEAEHRNERPIMRLGQPQKQRHRHHDGHSAEGDCPALPGYRRGAIAVAFRLEPISGHRHRPSLAHRAFERD